MKLLFICTHNRCRSILCEAIANQDSDGKLDARSAGSSPASEVHPLTLEHLKKHGYSVDGLTSDSWDAHESFEPDVVVTVCDQAAGESCPVWFGDSVKLHWGLADPSKLTDDPEAAAEAFSDAIDTIKLRTTQLAALAEQPLDPHILKMAMIAMGAEDK